MNLQVRSQKGNVSRLSMAYASGGMKARTSALIEKRGDDTCCTSMRLGFPSRQNLNSSHRLFLLPMSKDITQQAEAKAHLHHSVYID